MNRRSFLFGAGAGAIVLHLPADFCLQSGAGAREPALHDIRLRLLAYAIQAPSSHNAQPWTVELDRERGMRLFVDRSRLLPECDPMARQTYIGQGAFLALLRVAAQQLGYAAHIVEFPEGEPEAEEAGGKPVAEIEIEPQPGLSSAPLFPGIALRQSNKRVYDRSRPVAASLLEDLRTAALEEGGEPRIVWTGICQPETRQQIAGICRAAMSVEVADRRRNRETAAWFRFSGRELKTRRDGFGCAQSGTEGLTRWIAETFVLSRAAAENPQGAFARGAVAQAAEQAGSAQAFVALATRGNTRRDQVHAGAVFARAQLAAACRDLATQPLSQALEEYPAMQETRARLKSVLGAGEDCTVQMLFRLGYAKRTPRAPRRPVEALLPGAPEGKAGWR